MDYNIFIILILAGVIQGFVFTIIFCLNKKYRAKSTLFLVGLILIYSVNNLTYLLPDLGVMSMFKMYNTLFFPFASIIPVLIYFYVVFFLNPNKKMSFIEKMLFLPFGVLLINTLFFRVKYFIGNKEDIVDPNYVKAILFNETFSVLFSIVLLSICIYKIYKVQKTNKTFNPKIIQDDLKWLMFTISAILLFTFYWAYLTYLNIYSDQSGQVSFIYLWLIVAALVYWLGHIGIYKYGIISERKKIRKYLEANNQFKSIETNFKPSESNSFNQYIEKLKDLFNNEKIYLDSNLNLERISQYLQLSPTYLSKIIHTELQTSLPEFINQYRVEEAKRNLINSEFSKYTILSIGLEAGFNSKSSFYNTFKKYTGKTPLEYRNQLLQ